MSFDNIAFVRWRAFERGRVAMSGKPRVQVRTSASLVSFLFPLYLVFYGLCACQGLDISSADTGTDLKMSR